MQFIGNTKKMDIEKITFPYRQNELNKWCILFKWKSDIKLPYNMELLLRTNGSIGYATKLKKWVIGSWNGIVDEYNEPVTYVCRTLATQPETYELNKDDVIVCGNNFNFASDIEAMEFLARMRNETDTSIYYQLVYSRNLPIPIAENDKMKKQIEKALQAMRDGKPAIIVASLLDDVETLDILEKDGIEKMQYLSSFYDVLEKRNANAFGVDLSLVDKRAQVQEDELNQFDDVTSLQFLSAYEARLDFCERMKEAGIQIEVVRNPVFSEEASKEEIDSEEAQEEELEKKENQEGENENDKDNQTDPQNEESE